MERRWREGVDKGFGGEGENEDIRALRIFANSGKGGESDGG